MVMEDFVNRNLGENAVRAAQKVPPLSFKKVEERAKDLVERKLDYARIQNRSLPLSNSYNRTKDSRNKGSFQKDGYSNRNGNQSTGQEQKGNHNSRSELTRPVTYLRSQQNVGKICAWYNMKDGCKTSNCTRKHLCCNLPKGSKDMCREGHGGL